MQFSSYARGALAALFVTLPGLALAEIVISDPYARASRPNAPTGAAFMMIENSGLSADRLIGARSDIAAMVELHSHVDQGGGVMKMVEIEGGVEIAPGETYHMKRGGDHVMFMGLKESLEQGAEISVTLTFEQAGDITIAIPVDNDRAPEHGHGN
jgi:copper(I)-binding protein